MKKQRWGSILLALCLALAFGASQAAAAPTEDTFKKCTDGKDNDRDGDIDGADLDCEDVLAGGGGGGGGGGAQDIPLCMTLATAADHAADGIGGIAAIPLLDPLFDEFGSDFPYPFQTFCHNEGDLFHALIKRKGGVLAISMQTGAIERIQLDFIDCVRTADDKDPEFVGDPSCKDSRDFGDDPATAGLWDGNIVRGTPTKDEGRGIDQLAVLAFSIDQDVTALVADGVSEFDLTVQFWFFHIHGDPPGTIRGINYGPSVTGTIGISEDKPCASHKVRVTEGVDGTCWTVESFLDDEACLLRQTGHGGNTEIELQGAYNMPFTITLQAFSGDFDVDGNPLDVDGALGSCL